MHCTAISISIILIYAPPAMPIHVFFEFLDAFLDFCNLLDEKLIILGDFNVPQFIDHGTDGIFNKKSSVLINAVNFLDLRQLNCILNSQRLCLDLVLFNLSGEVAQADFPMLSQERYHPAIEISMCIGASYAFVNSVLNHESPRYNFRKANFQLLYDCILHED